MRLYDWTKSHDHINPIRAICSMSILKGTDGRTLPRIGILGGGQLGRMMADAAHRLGLQLIVLDPQGSDCPAAQYGIPAIKGNYTNAQDVLDFVNHCDVLTCEIEHVNLNGITKLLQDDPSKITLHPHPETIQLIQDKYQQKVFFSQSKVSIPIAPFESISTPQDALRIGKTFGYPLFLKARRYAYDGRGNVEIHSEKDFKTAFHQLDAVITEGDTFLDWKLHPDALYAEKKVPFVKEIAVMVARQDDQSTISTYPVVETVHENSICHTVLAPAQLAGNVASQAQEIAKNAVRLLRGSGMYGVELFLTADNTIYLNEIAPRPHNSGHYTLDACETDQFEQHLRAVAGLPLGSCSLRVNHAFMVNVLGSSNAESTYQPFQKSLSIPGATAYFYGKKGAIKMGRKLGHITIVASSSSELHDRVGAFDSSLLANLSGTTEPNMTTGKKQPIVGIIMGSDSDLSVMKEAARVLDSFDVPYELTIVSAHRTPHRMMTYAESAQTRGLKVIIAGAGGAAHLPGMVASMTTLPVVGVPIKTGALNGEDALLSIVQMPRGVPVATVAIGNATNAAMLAIRILGLSEKTREFMETQRLSVLDKAKTLAQEGWEQYEEGRRSK